jgi:hypothetical protein
MRSQGVTDEALRDAYQRVLDARRVSDREPCGAEALLAAEARGAIAAADALTT